MDSVASLTEGKKRFLKKTDNLITKNRESEALHGKVIYKKLIKGYLKALQKHLTKTKKGKSGYFAHAYDLICQIKVQLVAHFVLKTIIDPLSKPCLRNSLAGKIGLKLQDELNFRNLKNNHPKWWKRLETKIKKRRGYRYKRTLAVKAANEELKNWKIDWGSATRIHVGLTLIELLRTSTGLIQYDKRRVGKGKYSYYVVPTLKTLQWIQSFNAGVSSLMPYHLPCLSLPTNWTDINTGGYKFPEELNWSFVKTKNRQLNNLKYLKEANLELVFSAANTLQSVPHRVNPKILKFLLKCQEERVNVGGTTNQVTSLSGQYSERRNTCQAQSHLDRIRMMPDYIRTYNILSLASRFNGKTIFFPIQADFRGRLYYVPKLLNPQGCDMAKSLLQFETPLSVQRSEDWFLVGGANNYGIKGTYEERQKWILKHEKEIIKVADDPLANRNFWEQCDNPLVFVAWAFEFKEWLKNRLTFKTRLPVRLDHTASGLQIVSLLKNDKKLQELTNISDATTPIDVYQLLTDDIKNILITSGRPESHAWVSLGIDRKLIKNITVSFMYGGTQYGLEKTVVDWYIKKNNDIFGKDIYKEINQLLASYRTALNNISTAPIDFINECKEEQQTELLSWKSPSGFPVENLYHPTSKHIVKATVSGEKICGIARVMDSSRLSVRAARNAIAANRVHSYDSALMHQVINNHEWKVIQTLHDCYCITPSDCETFIKILPKTINDIFNVDMPNTLRYTAS
jgi:DNA-directed RNA polymerase